MARPYRKLLDVSDLPSSGGSQFNTGSYLENAPRRRLRRLRRLAGLRDLGTDQFNGDAYPCGLELGLAAAWPKGSWNAAMLACEALLDGQAGALTQKAITMAIRWCCGSASTNIPSTQKIDL